ncbi:hypothetical protein [Thalassotalea euphylliae]|uniref:Uncharacterized protein n=1 Tax=Thalassotalea euphylliae TaxID=1655234 RepID=A0A3E0U305_9GAMM|nr:hypothetical protein [Thalassotalea euphylliae]REL30585.1 hypothetical protein DXX94_07600 [Thalassotalea euphylliae]
MTFYMQKTSQENKGTHEEKESNTKALSIMEQWLQVLLLSYQTSPETQIVKYINYYLSRILSHEECQATKQKHCQYLRMQRYWQWHLQQSL